MTDNDPQCGLDNTEVVVHVPWGHPETHEKEHG